LAAGKYTLIEINYEESEDDDNGDSPAAGSRRGSKDTLVSSASSEQVESKLPKPVVNLMSLIFNTEYFTSTLAELEYDSSKMPLGKLSKKTVLQGYQALKQLSVLIVNSSSDAQAITALSNQYFSLIPHDFGRNRAPVLSQMDMIKKEVTLLENLTDMQLADQIMKTAKSDKVKHEEKLSLADRQYQGLGMQEMTPLDSKSTEFKELADYLIKSAGSTHYIRYQVQDIFRIERQDEDVRFKASKYAKLQEGKTDRRLLWHGSRTTNYGGILSQGLRIAPKGDYSQTSVPETANKNRGTSLGVYVWQGHLPG
jgi:poly [ADP-ribose] polymerase 2/3/4